MAAAQSFLELESLLENADEDVRYEAAHCIASAAPPPYERVCEWAKSSNPLRREAAAFLLGSSSKKKEADSSVLLNYPQAVPFLLEMLKDAEERVEQSAFSALLHHKDSASLPVLFGYAAHASEGLRWSLAQGLGAWDWEGSSRPYREEAVRVLLSLMDDDSGGVRDWAAFSMHVGGHDTPETRARLWKALEDADCNVRGEAVAGLARFEGQALIPELQRLLLTEEAPPSHYFEAAAEFGDPALLPAVLVASERWLAKGNAEQAYMTSAIEALKRAAFRE